MSESGTIERDFLVEDLEPLWLELEARSSGSFFQSWLWTRTWLSELPRSKWPWLVVIREDDRVIGLALLGKTVVWRKNLFRASILSMHETGDKKFDTITPEYAAPLAERGLEAKVGRRLLKTLLTAPFSWNELSLSAADTTTPIFQASGEFGLSQWVQDDSIGRQRDLSSMENPDDFLKALSSNARYQIRRSRKLYAKKGEVRLSEARSKEEAEAYFDEMGVLHQAYWTSRGKAGSFSEPFFTRFHRSLIKQGIETGEVKLIRLEAGDYVFGYLYNFFYRGVMSSYQSGFDYSDDKKLKPGLVGHTMAIEYAIGLGANTYDFLAGDSQYKRTLGDKETEMHWVALQKPKTQFMVESGLRKLKRATKKLRNRAGPSA